MLTAECVESPFGSQTIDGLTGFVRNKCNDGRRDVRRPKWIAAGSGAIALDQDAGYTITAAKLDQNIALQSLWTEEGVVVILRPATRELRQRRLHFEHFAAMIGDPQLILPQIAINIAR